MRVLVSAASRHGGTALIAQTIADEFSKQGIRVDLREPDQVGDVAQYDAVVLGSAVYMGSWLRPARELVRRQEAGLRERRLWLFSSGPLGPDHETGDAPPEVAAIVERTGARDHRVFGGRLDRTRLGVREKVVTAIVKAPEGDFRPLAEVSAWARSIARELLAVPA